MISNKIKLLREKHSDKQSDLAKKLNITRSSVNAWEMGISLPSTSNIVKIALLYNVSTDYLLGIEKNSTINITGLSNQELSILIELIEYFKNIHKLNTWYVNS